MKPSENQPYLPPQKKLTKKTKHKIILYLRIFILVMLVLILGLSVLLIGRALSSAFASNPSKQTTSHTDIATSTPSPVESTSGAVSVTPSPTTMPTTAELLPVSALADSFFGPLPTSESPVAVVHHDIHAIYLGQAAYLDTNIELAKNSEINAFVIDLKESNGVLFNSTNALASDIGVITSSYDLKKVIQKCHDNNILVIGRIVCFKDPELAKQKPEFSIKDAQGNPLYFKNEGSNSFVNPYDTRTWDYNIDIAIEAVQAGVDEIQFDYVRFPTGGTTTGEKPYFGDPATTPSKAEVINRFLQTARIRIQDEYGVPVMADVFAITLSSASDGASLGQDWASVGLTGIDSVCPMIYPSHYALNTSLNGQNFSKPDFSPHDVVYDALIMGSDEDSVAGFATVRPYLQAFTASYIGKDDAGNPNWMTYGYDQINAQIKAVQDAGLNEWILWNPAAKYPTGAYDGK